MPQTLTIQITSENKAALEGFKKTLAGLKGISAEIKTAGGNANRASLDMKKLSDSLSGLRGVGLGLTGAFAGIAAAFGAVTKRGVDMNVTLNQSRMALTQITGSSKAATQFVNALQVEAQKSILTFKELLPLAQSLAASYGPNGLGKVIPTIRAFGDTAAALGVSRDAQERALLGFRQLLARVTPSQQDVNQVLLNLPGLNISNILKQKFGTADTETLARAHHTGAEVADAIVEGMQKQFGGAQARLANTLPGILSNFGDAFDALSSKLTAEFTPKVTRALGSVLQSVQGLTRDKASIQALKAPFDSLAGAIESVAGHIQNSIRWFQRLSPEAKTALTHIAGLAAAFTGVSGAGLLAASALGSIIRNAGQIAPLLKPLISLLGSKSVGAAMSGSLVGSLSTIGLMGATAFVGWQIGRAIHDLTPLGKALDDILNKLMHIESFTTGDANSARKRFAGVARQLAGATIPGQAQNILNANPSAATKIQQEATRLGIKGDLTTLQPMDYERIAKAIEAEMQKTAKVTRSKTTVTGTSGGGSDAGEFGKGQPAFIQKMLSDAANNVKEGLLQCGGVISKALQASGIDATVTQLRNQARKDASKQAFPSGFDKQGRPLYDPGTLFFFPPGGRSRQQHFAASTGGQSIVEYTTAGGGGYHFRTDRTLSQIAGEHGGRFEAFQSGAAGSFQEAAQSARESAQKRNLSNSLSLADRLNSMWQKIANLQTQIKKDNEEFDKAAAEKMAKGMNDALTGYLDSLEKSKDVALRNEDAVAASHLKTYDLRTEKEKELDRLKEENARKEEERAARQAELEARYMRINMEGFANRLKQAQDAIFGMVGPLNVGSDGKGGNKVTSQINNDRLQEARERMKRFYDGLRKDADYSFKGIGQSFFENLFMGGKQAKDAFKNLFSDVRVLIARALSNVVVENLSNIFRGGLGSIFGGSGRAKSDEQTASIVKDGQNKLSGAFTGLIGVLTIGKNKLFGAISLLASVLGSLRGGGGGGRGHKGLFGKIIDALDGPKDPLSAVGAIVDAVVPLPGNLGGGGGTPPIIQAGGGVSSIASLGFSRPVSLSGRSLGFSSAPSVRRLRSQAAMAEGGDIHVNVTQHVARMDNKTDLMNSWEDVGYVVKQSLRWKVK